MRVDGFVTKLNPTGSGLVYSTFLGGYGNDSLNTIAVNSAGSRTDFNRPGEIFGKLLPEIAKRAGVGRARVAVLLVTRGQRFGVESNRAGCEVAAAVAGRIGLPSGVGESMHQIFEWWNGKGAPRRLKGEAIALPARVVQVAAAGVLFHSVGGNDLALGNMRGL